MKNSVAVNLLSQMFLAQFSEEEQEALGMAIDALNALPSAEPKTGEWIHDGYDFPHGNDWIHCSVCGKRGINVPADLTNFCPNCGADMRGEEE